MISDSKTNTLYLADCLQSKCPTFFTNFEKVLNKCNISFKLLPNTKDIWAVDYMPIQVSLNKYIQFHYNPDYLQKKKWAKTISDVDSICDSIKLNRIKSDIVLDGGNVIKTENKVIMCDKIFSENRKHSKHNLSEKLRELFEVDDLFFIPKHPKDYTGHADGMLRFIDENTVLINDYSKEKKEFQTAFKNALNQAGLKYVKIPYNPYSNKNSEQANGIYINFLQIKNTIIVPTFGLKEDEIAVRIIEDIYKGQSISTIESNNLANKGGILNCITWNIFTEKSSN